jgi:hypothetical protein
VAPFQPVGQVSLNLVTLVIVIKNRGVNLFQPERGIGLGNGLRGAAAVDKILQNRLNTDSRPFHPNIVRR